MDHAVYGEDLERELMSEEMQAPEVVEQDAEEIVALFASELEPETVDIPGRPGSWVTFQAMDAADLNAYRNVGQKIRVSAGKAEMGADVTTDQEAQEMFLLTHTVVDFCLLRKKRGRLGDEEREILEETRPPEAASQRKAFMTGEFRRITPQFRKWLVKEAKRVNGLRELDLGNWLSSSGS